MSLAVLAMAWVLAAPFEDVSGRFTVDLPPGWAFAPQPGDTGGAYFNKNLDGMLANATVRVMPFSVPVDLENFAARIAAASDQEPGYKVLLSENTTVAGNPALKRRFVVSINGDRRWSKVVEQRLLVVGSTGYVLHAETVADAFGTFEKDFGKFFASFKPASPALPVPTPQRTKSRRTDLRALIGRWEGGGHSLQLSPAGVVILDGVQGTYRVDNGVLVFALVSDQRIFEFHLAGDSLKLSGGSFGDGQSFKRSKTK